MARRALETWNAGDLEALLALCHRGIRFRSFIGALEGDKAHRGHDGVRSWWAEAEEAFEDRRMEVEEITARGEWVVFTGVGLGTGRASRAEVRWPFVGAARVADGLLSEWRLFGDRAEADAFLGDAA